jgi:phosphatidylglycerol:prolipoprotein diacylglycerol transferase
VRPVLWEFELFGRTLVVHGYGLAIGLGFLAFYLMLRAEGRRLGNERLERGALVTLVALGAAIYLGGKLLYWWTTPDAPRDLSGQGFVFFGSLLACLPVAAWRARSAGMRPLAFLDALAVAAPLGHAFGRVGCFLAGCCYGSRCALPWAVTFERGVGLNGAPLHPVQLYEAAGLLAIFALLLALRRRKRFDGQLVMTYLAAYSALRVVTESFRGDPERGFVFEWRATAPGDAPGGISTSTAISFAVAALSLAALALLRRRARAAEAR